MGRYKRSGRNLRRFLILIILIGGIYAMNTFENIPGHAMLNKAMQQAESNIISWFTYPNIIDCTGITPQASRERMSTNYIVIHHDDAEGTETYSPFPEILSYHQAKGLGTFAYHYYISKSGKVYQMHPFESFTNHTDGYNAKSVAVCVNGRYNTEQMPEAQYKALVKTLAYLLTQAPDATIVGHREVCQTDCPGANVNISMIRKNAMNHQSLKQLITE
jgi:N-acetyl-anhydromuramyl-L-alanine amidase AmpD